MLQFLIFAYHLLLHEWSFHMKVIKRALGEFNKFISNIHQGKILFYHMTFMNGIVWPSMSGVVCNHFPLVISCLGFEGWSWVLIASVPDLYIRFTLMYVISQ